MYRNASPRDAEQIPSTVAPAVLSIAAAGMAVSQDPGRMGAPRSSRPVLLHGVTGSGKTEVYMELIDQVIHQGRQAIVLIPEIALTYQTVRRFYGRFGDKVSVINSRLSLGERYDQFKRAKQGELQVMVGPRSALFTPFGKLGLIIIDEEHESSYKSETQSKVSRPGNGYPQSKAGRRKSNSWFCNSIYGSVLAGRKNRRVCHW